MTGNNDIRVGVSTCLLGEEVRHDGGHKRDRFVVDELGAWVHFIPLCPEVAIGMGTPREPIRLVDDGGRTRLIGTRSATDHTEAMETWAREKADRVADMALSGWIFKSKSPSCGLFRVKLYRKTGQAGRDGRGLFAAALAERLPDLPMEEEGRLNDARLRENFVERLFTYHRLAGFFSTDWTLGDLVAFHSREKLLLMAHSPQAYRDLGKMVADSKGRDRMELEAAYRHAFMGAMAKRATPGRQANVLRHMAGYVKKHLDADGRAELSEAIEDYRTGLVPLIVPLTLIRHLVRRFGIDYLADQTQLQPHPKELMLRNHV